MVIHAIDKASIGGIHTMFNAAMLLTLSKSFPEAEIIFYAEESHLEAVKNKLSQSYRISFQPVNLISTKEGGSLNRLSKMYQKIQDDLVFLKKIFSKTKDGDIVFLCSAAIIPFFLFSRLVKKYPTRVIATLHGELEYVFFSSGVREKWIGKIYRKILKTKAPNLSFLLLNKISKSRLVSSGLLCSSRIIDINHPYIFPHSNDLIPYNDLNYPLKIGSVGSLGIRKSGHLIYELATFLQDNISKNLVQISSIGPIEPNVISYRNDLVKDGYSKVENNSEYLTRRDFENKVSQLDYALFFYNEEQFIYRASGAVLDVIVFQKPIIAFDHPYFKYLFSLVGEIGYLCKDINEMSERIKKISENMELFKDDYRKQVANIEKLNRILSIDSVAKDLRQQFDNPN